MAHADASARGIRITWLRNPVPGRSISLSSTLDCKHGVPLGREREARKLYRSCRGVPRRVRQLGSQGRARPALHLSVKNECLNWLAVHLKISDR
jgi:hypothetical protein